MNNNINLYKCYIRAMKANMKLCGIYYKKDYILIRILGESKLVYSINIFDNGIFDCSCKYYINFDGKKICKHVFYLFFKVIKIFRKWLSSSSKIYLKRYSTYDMISFDENFLNGKLNDISLLLFKKRLRINHFKILDQKLFELDNFYLKYKIKDNPIHRKYISQNKTSFDGECLICLNTQDNNFKCPSCKKIFHLKCINKWIDINPSCPHCRLDMLDYKKYLDLINMEYNKI